MTIFNVANPDTTQPAADAFVDLLRQAAPRVPQEFMEHPYLDLAGVRRSRAYERPYCYALYDMTMDLARNSDDPRVADALAAGFTMSAEVEKFASYIDERRAPDFIWHVPGEATNGVVAEVKSSRSGLQVLREDVKKLACFMTRPAEYRTGVLLVFGDLSRTRRRNLSQVADDHCAVDGRRVVVLLHEAAGAPLVNL